MKPGEEPKIYMNQLDLLIRRRLTCALELGHYVRRAAVEVWLMATVVQVVGVAAIVSRHLFPDRDGGPAAP
jgi:hypothetical protein